jgi:hypothetical protein
MQRALLLRPWTPAEDARLMQLVSEGKPGRSIAMSLRRSLSAVSSRKRFLKITTRQKSPVIRVGAMLAYARSSMHIGHTRVANNSVDGPVFATGPFAHADHKGILIRSGVSSRASRRLGHNEVAGIVCQPSLIRGERRVGLLLLQRRVSLLR